MLITLSFVSIMDQIIIWELMTGVNNVNEIMNLLIKTNFSLVTPR